LGAYDPEALTYRWRAADPRVDALQQRVARIVEQDTAGGASIPASFERVRAAVLAAAGRHEDPAREPVPAGSVEGRPRLTEPWFC
nr:radical SAM protein [Thermoleophilaceae bacterium]